MKHHTLKILFDFYRAVLAGEKTFEIRYNDRDFKSGDTVQLIPIDLATGAILSGPQPVFRIGFVTDYQQEPGYVAFSLKPLRPIQDFWYPVE